MEASKAAVITKHNVGIKSRSYNNLFNFVKVIPKILVVPFLPDTV